MSVLLITEEKIPAAYRFSLTQKLAEKLADRGERVFLVSTSDGAKLEYPGIIHKPVVMKNWDLLNLMSRLKANIRICLKTLMLCYTKDIKLVYGWWPILFFAKLFAFKKVAADMPEFMDIMYKSYNKPLTWLVCPLLKFYQTIIAKFSTFIVNESEISREIWAKRGVKFDKTYNIPYGVETKKFSVATKGNFRKKLNISDDEIVLLFHGDIGIDDGVDILIEAANSLPVKVIIAGDGDLKYMNELKKNSSLNIIFTGWIKYEMIPELIAECDICVAPFRSSMYTNSTCQLKQMEAMAAGKPTIISKLQTFSQYVKDKHNCLLVEPGNVEQLRIAIFELLNNSDERIMLGKNAKTDSAQFDWQIPVKKLCDILIKT